MSKLRTDELVNKEGDGSPSFPYGATSTEPTLDNQVATKSYVDNSISGSLGNVVSLTPPENPAIGTFWTDTSVSPTELKVWNGSVWLELSGEVSPYTGFIGSPVEVLTPLDGAGVGGAKNVTPMTDLVTSAKQVAITRKLEPNEIGIDLNTYEIAACEHNGRLVMMSNQKVSYSDDDGYSWTDRMCPGIGPKQMVHNGTNYVVVGSNGILYSADGESWSSGSIPSYSYPWSNFMGEDIAYDPSTGRLAACGSFGTGAKWDNAKTGIIYSNDNGANWSHCTYNDFSEYTYHRSIAFHNGMWCTAPNQYTYNYYSSNGINWTKGGRSAGGSHITQNLVYDDYNNRFITTYYRGGREDQGYYQSFDGIDWDTYTLTPPGDQSSNFCRFNSVAYGKGSLIFGMTYDYNQVYFLSFSNLSLSANDFVNGNYYINGWAWKRANGYPYDNPTRVFFTGNRFIVLLRDQKNGKWYLNFYRKGDPTTEATTSEAPWYHTHYSTTLQTGNYFGTEVTLASNKVFDADDNNNQIPSESLEDFFTRNYGLRVALTDGSNTATNASGNFQDIYPYNSNGLTVQITDLFNRDDIVVGQRFKYMSQATVFGPSPSEIVFTSQNANTTPFNGTDATLAFRKWTLETRASSSDPWTLVVESDDYSVVDGQDGSTPWPEAPTLQPNTSYRIKVAYHSANADPVESEYSTFETGSA